MRINYTTYDVRRGQDTINPKTDHRDIMLLVDEPEEDEHPFLYARVLGIFHVNVIFTGQGMVDYHPRRFEFLWVWWFDCVTEGNWQTAVLNRLSFFPMSSRDAFGFVDPADVLRACHIIPTFSWGQQYLDGQGLSSVARDSQDWKLYVLNRCVFSFANALI